VIRLLDLNKVFGPKFFVGHAKERVAITAAHSDEVSVHTGLPIGLEQPLCSLGVRGAALEPASHERINLRGKSQLSRSQHKPRV
jgi:hypothetical protein